MVEKKEEKKIRVSTNKLPERLPALSPQSLSGLYLAWPVFKVLPRSKAPTWGGGSQNISALPAGTGVVGQLLLLGPSSISWVSIGFALSLPHRQRDPLQGCCVWSSLVRVWVRP